MTITILYFAGLRETLGRASETIDGWKPASIGDLRASLVARGGAYATALAPTRNVRGAINQEMVKADAMVNDGDEVAFFPARYGRLSWAMVKVQADDFDLTREIAALREAQGARAAQIGAIASFVGTVRDMNDVGGQVAGVSEMVLEHYPGMTERALEKIVAEAKSRFNIYDALVIHRYGTLKPKDQIVLAAAVGAHRGEAFAACEFMMDYLKTEAPFWKKESTPDGVRWVDSRESDNAARGRWEAQP